MIGTTLGHYRILELLGKGGMGEVYLADDTKLQRRVAVKVLSPELAIDPDRRERFAREARAAAALNHPNIVTIHSVEEVAGVPFLTLELVEGQTLADLTPEHGLPLDKVLTLSIPLTDAVGAAHQRGITHRDLKPANVMVAADGRVKVLDFGLAKLKEDANLSAAAGMPTAELTGHGRIVGTVSYMSPEQGEGKPVDQRSDVFSLGVMLYEMATGRRPFTGDTQMSILSSILKDTPPTVSEVRRDLPKAFAKIVSRCLSKDVEDRYQSAKDLRNDLRALKSDLTSGEVVVAPSTLSADALPAPAALKRSRAGLYAATLIGLAALAAVAVYFTRRPAAGTAATATRPFDTIQLTRLTTTGTAGAAAISADGRYVAHVSIKAGQQGVWLRQVATSSNVEVVPAGDFRYVGVAFSPDGNHLYLTRYPQGSNFANLVQVPVLGGGARVVVEDIDSPPAFDPSGARFAFVRGLLQDGADILVANADGSGAKVLAHRTATKTFALRGASWSPDGKTIAAAGLDQGALKGEVVLLDAETGAERLLPIPHWRFVSGVAWLHDGSGLLVNAQETAGECSSQIFHVAYPSTAVRRLTSDLSSYVGLSLAPDGKSFVCVRNDLRSTIWIQATGSGEKATAITTDAGADDGAQGLGWTPDGRIVYVSEAGGNPDLWIMSEDGSRRVQLTTTPGADVNPAVTPDGRAIVFVSDRDGGVRLWKMSPDGTGATRISADLPLRGHFNLSFDGKWIFFTDVSLDHRKVSIDGGTSVSLFPGGKTASGEALPTNSHDPALGPDGVTISLHYDDPAARNERMLLVAPGGTITRYPALPPASWGPDGKAFHHFETKAGATNGMRFALPNGPSTPMTQFTSDQIFRATFSPDFKRVAFSRGRTSSDVVLITAGK